jgi:hypothetical protein
MTDQNQTSKKSNHILTILVDLSHPAFADRGIIAQLGLIEVLKSCAEAVAVGSEATLIETGKGRVAIATYNIINDDDGQGKAAFDAVVEQNRKMLAFQRAAREQQETASASN